MRFPMEAVEVDSLLSRKSGTTICSSRMLIGDRDLPEGIENKEIILDPDNGDLQAFEIETVAVDDPKWEEWHNEHRAIGGSTIASLLGHGYDSPRAAIMRHLKLKPEKPFTAFNKIAMGHGRFFESYALRVCDLMTDGDFSANRPAGNSTLFRVHSKSHNKDLLMITTPDYYDGSNVLEIKCPYVNSTKTACAMEFRSLWSTKVPFFGKTAYFLQAAFYAWLCDLKPIYIYTAVAFVTNNEDICVRLWKYNHSESIDMFFTRFAQELMNTTAGSLRMTKQDRLRAEQLVEDHFISMRNSPVYSIGIDGSLEEKREDDSGDD